VIKLVYHLLVRSELPAYDQLDLDIIHCKELQRESKYLIEDSQDL
jgi:hypothetical protein